jgi:hypothetical protein
VPHPVRVHQAGAGAPGEVPDHRRNRVGRSALTKTTT